MSLGQVLETSQSLGFGVDLAMAGLTEHLAVGQFVVATLGGGLLVVELRRPSTASAVVGARTQRAFARAPSTLSRQSLHRIGKRQHPLLDRCGNL